MFANRAISLASLVAIFLLACAASAFALPYDMDMADQDSFQAREMARAPAEGTVPLGHQPFTMTNDEAAGLENPVEFNRNSVWRGRRLWSVNCHTCHGATGDGKGPVGPPMQVPSLLEEFYKSRSDGRIYAVIQNGQNNMPRYGYKFTEAEQWDLVNYLRFLQGKDVDGMSRP